MGVVVVAAGLGTRLGADVPKALVPVRGVPLVRHAVLAARQCPGVREVVVTAPPGHEAAVRAALSDLPAVDPPVRVVTGGSERPDSVRAGLAALGPDPQIVLVHDAARGLTPPAVFTRVVDAVASTGAAVVPGLPVVDTVKTVDENGLVLHTPPRSALRAVQTPQGFPREVLERVHRERGAAAVTDDAGLAEAAGLPVFVVPGDADAAKVTTPPDLLRGTPVLLVIAGLPGTGKTTTARAWAAAAPGRRAHLRVDTAEQALVRAGVEPVGAGGYAVTQAIAADLLRTGVDVVADAVNPVPEAWAAWRAVAEQTGARLVQIHLTCSDAVEHARRVRERRPDIPGHRLPTWEDVRAIAAQDHAGAESVVTIDVAGLSPGAVLAAVEGALP